MGEAGIAPATSRVSAACSRLLSYTPGPRRLPPGAGGEAARTNNTSRQVDPAGIEPAFSSSELVVFPLDDRPVQKRGGTRGIRTLIAGVQDRSLPVGRWSRDDADGGILRSRTEISWVSSRRVDRYARIPSWSARVATARRRSDLAGCQRSRELPGVDSNHGHPSQSQRSCRWTNWQS